MPAVKVVISGKRRQFYHFPRVSPEIDGVVTSIDFTDGQR
jgi:hypothetical protein